MSGEIERQFVLQGDIYEVEKLVGMKNVNGQWLYRVRWRGYNAQSDTLEPEENLFTCREMIEKLHKERSAKLAKRKMKKTNKIQNMKCNKESKTIISGNTKETDGAKWESVEEQTNSNFVKDTFWKDFQEGRIDVFEQDMYSKVKERAARMGSLNDTNKNCVDFSQKDVHPLQLCPKVILKRRSTTKIQSARQTDEPIEKRLPVKKIFKKRNKRRDELRDYRKRRYKRQKKYKVYENKCFEEQKIELDNDNIPDVIKARNNLIGKASVIHEDCSLNDCEDKHHSGCSNVLQELLVNDEETVSNASEFSLSSFLSSGKTEQAISITNSKCFHSVQISLPLKDHDIFSSVKDTSNSKCQKPELMKKCISAYIIPEISQEQNIEMHVSSSITSIKLPDDLASPTLIASVQDSINCQRNSFPERELTLDVINRTVPNYTKGILEAVKQGNSKLVLKLLDDDLCLNVKEADSKGFTLLMTAASLGFVEIVENLYARGASVNATQPDGTTALMISSKLGYCDMVKILLKLGAHKDLQNEKGETALMMACQHGKCDVVNVLLQHGANFALTNTQGINVLRMSKTHANSISSLSIFNEHISRMKLEFEGQARHVIYQTAKIQYALFPIHCFSLNEGPSFTVTFSHHVQLGSPGKGSPEKEYLLFIANTTIKKKYIKCLFYGDSPVLHVAVNGVKEKPLQTGSNFVYTMSRLLTGRNEVLITAAHDPQSQRKLVVCAYRVHHIVTCTAQCTTVDSALNVHPLCK